MNKQWTDRTTTLFSNNDGRIDIAYRETHIGSGNIKQLSADPEFLVFHFILLELGNIQKKYISLSFLYINTNRVLQL